jgi:hypothetical protein
LFSNERVFPIRIDPSIVHDTTTEFDTGSDYNTEVVTGPKVKLEDPEAYYTDSNVVGYWKLDENTSADMNDGYPSFSSWSNTSTSSCGSYNMMGGYNIFGSGAYTQKTISNLPAGTYIIAFNYYHVDSWDGESGRAFWNGSQIWSRAHTTSGDQICGGSWGDSVGLNYGMTYVVVNHTGGDATLKFDSTLDQGATDESWGVNNISVSDFNIEDESSYSNDGATMGSTYVEDGRLGGTRYFDGSNDHVKINSPTGIPIGNSSYTIEVWVKPESIGTGGIVGWGSYGTTNGVNALRFGGTSSIVNYWWGNDLTVNVGTIEVNSWHHIVATFDGTTRSIYFNGKLVGSDTPTGHNVPNADNLTIGVTNETEYFDGLIDEVRISNVARTEDEIKRLYQIGYEQKIQGTHISASLDMDSSSDIESITWTSVGDDTGDGELPYSTTGLVGQWDFNETSGITATNEGSCGTNCNGTLTNFSNTTGQDVVVGSGWTSDNRRWGNGAVMFDGSDDYITAGSDSALNIYNSGLTLETWVKTSYTPTYSDVIMQRMENAMGASGYSFEINSNGTLSSYYYYYGSGPMLTSNQAINDDRWHHIVATFGSTDYAIYIDGHMDVQGIGSYPTSGSSVDLSFNIGRFSEAPDGYFKGSIDLVRVYSRALNSSEILSNYQSGNIEMRYRTSSDGSTWSSWSGSETAVESFDDEYLYDTTESGLVSYWPLDEGSVGTAYDVTGNNNGTTSGVQIADGKNGNSIGHQSGSSATVPDSTSLDITSNLTLEYWFRPSVDVLNMAATYPIGVFKRDYQIGGYGSHFYNTNGKVNFQWCYSGGTTTLYSDTIIEGGNWYHYAATYDGSTARLYINGVEEDSAAVTTAMASSAGYDLSLGSQTFEGLIDEVKIYNTALSASAIREHWEEGSTNPNTLKTTSSLSNIEGDRALEISSNGTSVDGSTVGYWKLDESSGTGAYLKDSSSNGNDGTPTGTTFVKDGKSGGARSFDGSGSISLGNPSSLQITGNQTIEMWLKPADFSARRNPYAKAYGGEGTITQELNGTLNYYYGTAGGNTTPYQSFNTGVALTLNEWNYVALVRDLTGMTLSWYVNGQIIRTTVATYSSATASALTAYIGTGYTSSYSGEIDEVRISNTVRTSEEIAEAYRMGKDYFVSKSIDSTDISNHTMLPFWIASDALGTNMEMIYGESPYVNYQPDENTVGLWHLDNHSEYPRTCSDISNIGITSSGIYSIDPDGISGNDPFDAYCDMSYDGGGWTLLDNFVSSLSGDSDPYGAAIGDSDIRNGTDLTNAGYTTYLNAFESTSYTRQIGYLQMFYSSSPIGYMEKTLPSYADEVYVKWGNWYTGTATLKIGGTTVQSLSSSYGAATYQGSYSSGNAIRMEENGIFWAGEIWVRDNSGSTISRVEDSSGYSNDGVNQGGEREDGVLGESLNLNGTTEYIVVSEDNALDPSEITVEAWIKPSVLQLGNFVNKGNNSGYRFRTTTTGVQFLDRGGTNILSSNSSIPVDQWSHVVATGDSSGLKIYINGKLDSSNSTAYGGPNTTDNLILGKYGTDVEYYSGGLDEVRISNIARTPDEIRQAYEIGRRIHPINIDFKASLQSSNLISSSGDTSFTISEEDYGTLNPIEHIDVGEKIVVKENIGGTEYIAQGNLATVNTSTGAVTVTSWDSGSTFPTSGFTLNATVFKWQREYIDIRYPLDEDINGITELTFRKNTDVSAIFWVDDAKKATYSSDYNASAFTAIEGVRYIQYQPIFTRWDDNPDVDLYLSEIDISYFSGPTNEQLMRHGKWFDSSGVEQPFWWVGDHSTPEVSDFTVTYAKNPSEGGTLSFYTETVSDGSSNNPPTVTTNTGYTFDNFTITSGSCGGTFNSTTGSCSNVTSDMTIQANWTLNSYTVTYTRNPIAGGSLSFYSQSVNHGSSATGPTVTTNSGYTFSNFTITNGSCAGTFTSSTGTCSSVTGNMTIQANWSSGSTYYTVDASPGGLIYWGTVQNKVYSQSVLAGSSNPAPQHDEHPFGYYWCWYTITAGSCAGTWNSSTGVCSNVQSNFTIGGYYSVNPCF